MTEAVIINPFITTSVMKGLITHSHTFQYMEWHNLGVKKLKHDVCSPNTF